MRPNSSLFGFRLSVHPFRADFSPPLRGLSLLSGQPSCSGCSTLPNSPIKACPPYCHFRTFVPSYFHLFLHQPQPCLIHHLQHNLRISLIDTNTAHSAQSQLGTDNPPSIQRLVWLPPLGLFTPPIIFEERLLIRSSSSSPHSVGLRIPERSHFASYLRQHHFTCLHYRL